MRRLTAPLTTLLALSLFTGASQAVSVPASITTQRTLTSAAAVKRTCSQTADRAGRGVAVSHYSAPISGYVTGRLAGPATSDWDLVAVDRASGNRMATSAAFGSNEVVQTWVAGGQKLDFLACRRSGSARSVRLSVEDLDVKPPAGGGTATLVRVHGAPGQFAALSDLGLDVTHSEGADWADVVITSAKQLALLKSTHLPYSTRIADLAAYDARTNRADAAYTARVGAAGSTLPSGRTTYRTYTDIQNDLKALADKYPTLVKPVTLGQTFQGRDITGLEISDNVAASDGKPTFFLMGEHHAREWPSAEIPLEYAYNLVQNQSDPRVANLLAHEVTTIVPVVNIDGYSATRQDEAIDPYDNALASGPGNDVNNQLPLTGDTIEGVAPPGGNLAYRRKNCDGAIPSGNVPCELQYGVDNNRNYGNLWGGPGASQDPTSQSYHGPGPRSEPETQAVWNYSRTHQVTALISLHTIAALVLRPPGEHTAGLAPDETRLKQLGDQMGTATGYTSEYGWQLYDTAGTTEDDTYAAEGGYGYTIEMGPAGGVFHGPYQQYVVDQWNKGDVHGNGGLHDALMTIAEAAANRGDHGVITGTAPAGAELTLAKDFDTKTSPFCDAGLDPVITVATTPDQLACPGGVQDAQTIKDSIKTTMTVPASGSFAWDVNPSTRPFVGGGATVVTLADKPDRQLTTSGGGPGETPNSVSGTYDFTIGQADQGDLVKIDVSWATPEDYDIVVYRVNADGSKSQVGSSGNSPGQPEQVQLRGEQATPGKYELEVDDFAAVAGTWNATIGFYKFTQTITTGHAESYDLTCSVGGKTVGRTVQVFVNRGQSVSADPCQAGAPAVAGNPATAIPTGGSSTKVAAVKHKVTHKARAHKRHRAKRHKHRKHTVRHHRTKSKRRG